MNHILSRPTLLITATETVVNTQEVYDGRQKRWKLKVEVTGVKPASLQQILLQQKHLLLLLSYLWHNNRYFAFTHGNSTHPTLNLYGRHLTSDNSSRHEHLHYGKMAAVSIKHNAYRKLRR